VITVDREAIERRVRQLSAYVTMHAGGVELEDVTDAGEVHLRFTGMCTGCPFRPVTMAATVRPALMEIEGVTSVHAVGSRISAQAEARMAEDFVGYRTGLPIWPVRHEGSDG
jgi:Fe-S cluster biogenesis protein NfuA